MPCLSAKATVSRAVVAVSLSAPTTNMPWHLMPWRCRAVMAPRDVLDRLRLGVAVQRRLVDRLETEGETMAAGALHERQQLFVAGHVGAHLGHPLRA